ncbi:MAG: ZIP family metal transporter [Bacilli bacterium]
MKIINALLISLIASFSTCLGCIFLFFNIKKENINKFITFSLAFSIAIMIGISIFDLLPDSVIILIVHYKYISIPIFIILFLISYILIKILNKLLNKYENNLYKLGILSMIVLIMHNLPEGIITFISSYKDINLGVKMAFAIAMHNLPEGIAIAVPIYYSTKSKKKAFIKTFLSGFSEFIGAIIAYLFLAKYVNDISLSLILTMVAFLMITLSIEQMLPQVKKYNENKYIHLGLIIGFIIILLSVII